MNSKKYFIKVYFNNMSISTTYSSENKSNSNVHSTYNNLANEIRKTIGERKEEYQISQNNITIFTPDSFNRSNEATI